MSAYYRRRGEDRVTEVLATVLDQSAEFLHALINRIGLPSAAEYQVRTQVPTAGVTIDLEVQGRRSDGSPEWFLWSEHKVNDPLTARQLENEQQALSVRAGAARSHLMAITLLSPTPAAITFAATAGCTLLRWRDVTDLARAERNRAGREARRDTTVAGHLINEWIAFADNELEAPVDALTPERVQLLPEAEATLDTLAHIHGKGFMQACADIGAGTPKADYSGEIHATPPRGSWLGERGFRLYTKYLGEGGFGDAEAPCFVVGAWVEGHAATSERRSRELHTILGARGLASWDEQDRRGGWIEFGIGVSLVALAAHETLAEQTEAFGAACTSTLRTLAEPLE